MGVWRLPPQAKAMSACDQTNGGALVAPDVVPKKRKKNKAALVAKVLKTLEVE